nr:MAG TPA: Maltodextrin-binding protein,Interferon regulatory factor 3 E6 protein, E6AP, LxxLL [Caudoviricetes sp.]
MVRVSGKWRKYCKECAREIRIKQTVDARKC